MALEEYEGTVIVEIDGQEVEVESVSVKRNSMRKLVKTMNKTGRAKGFTRLMEEISLTISAPAKIREKYNWAGLEGGKVTITPLGGGDRTTYADVFSTSVGRAYKTDTEALFDVEAHALREVTE